jgi:DNA-binding MarR family transcriptional regulator
MTTIDRERDLPRKHGEALVDARMRMPAHDGPTGTNVEVDDQRPIGCVLGAPADYRSHAGHVVLAYVASSADALGPMIRVSNCMVRPRTKPSGCQVPCVHPGDPQNLGYLMLDGSLAMTAELLRELTVAGFDDLRPAHLNVVQHLDERGSRITDLAERAGLTKQTVVHTVNALERLGYTQRVADTSDARAKLVVPTHRGQAATDTGRRIVERIEARWAKLIGASELARLRGLLLKLNSQLWPQCRTVVMAATFSRPDSDDLNFGSC